MPQKLGVEVMHLKGTVVHVSGDGGDGGGHEEGVVVDWDGTAVDAGEEGDFAAGGGACGGGGGGVGGHVEDVRGVEIEVLGVPGHLGREVVDVDSEVAELETGYVSYGVRQF